jgi:hypothetical protein
MLRETTMHPHNAPYTNVKTLLAFFQEHPNRTFSAEELCERTGIARGSLQGSFQILAKGHPEIVKVSRGMFRYRETNGHAGKATEKQRVLETFDRAEQQGQLGVTAPPAAPVLNGHGARHSYELLGATPGGDKIVCLEDGQICCLVPLGGR